MTSSSAEKKDQVELYKLLFAMNWEDPATDRRAVAVQPGNTVMTITSGCCNTLTLLLDDPGKVYAVDINPTQSYLLELKSAAIRQLDCEQLHQFLGLSPCDVRAQLFEKLSGDLSPAALAYWKGRPDAIVKGIMYSGKFESLVHIITTFIRVLQGHKRIERLFQCKSLEEQRTYFEKDWNNRRWRLIFDLLANKRVISARMGLNYFQFEDGSTSFSESFQKRFQKGICDTPVQTNYFLALFFCGHYRSGTAIPEYLLPENLPVVKRRLDRIVNVLAPAADWLEQQPPQSIDAFVLSNIGELMSESETNRLFATLLPAAAPGARICFRNILIPRAVPQTLAEQIVLNPELSQELLATDRSFLYSRVNAYVVKPGVPGL